MMKSFSVLFCALLLCTSFVFAVSSSTETAFFIDDGSGDVMDPGFSGDTPKRDSRAALFLIAIFIGVIAYLLYRKYALNTKQGHHTKKAVSLAKKSSVKKKSHKRSVSSKKKK